MAEFKEIMKNFVRARKYMNLGDRPLIRKSADELTEKDIDLLETDVLMFIEDHPDPKNPSWLDFLIDLDVLSINDEEQVWNLPHLPFLPGSRLREPIPDEIYELYKAQGELKWTNAETNQ